MRALGRHVVTIYNRLAEVERQATWRHTTLAGVTVEERSGSVAAMNGSTSSDGVMLFVPGGMPGYKDPSAFDGTAGWTLRKGDVVVVGTQSADAPADGEHTYRITGVERFDGRLGIDHFEVAGA